REGRGRRHPDLRERGTQPHGDLGRPAEVYLTVDGVEFDVVGGDARSGRGPGKGVVADIEVADHVDLGRRLEQQARAARRPQAAEDVVASRELECAGYQHTGGPRA